MTINLPRPDSQKWADAGNIGIRSSCCVTYALVTHPDSHPIEPRDFSGKRPRVALSKPSLNQTREQSQVIQQNMTESLGSMKWEMGYMT